MPLPADPSCDIAIDVECFDKSGRSLMSEDLQRRWPFDTYVTSRPKTADSWRYDYLPNEINDITAYTFFCGLVLGPRDWQSRILRM